MLRYLACGSLLFLVLAGELSAQNWPGFRGDGQAVSDLQGLPTTWSEGDYAWRVELPGEGHAAPCVWDNKVFITSAEAEGALRHVFCLDAKSGEEIWSRTIGHNPGTHSQKSSFASASPVCDGERVYVSFADSGKYGLTAYTLDGDLVWRRNVGGFESEHGHGHGASPLLWKDFIFLTNDQDGPSAMYAFDRRTGDTVWTSVRAPGDASYSTPQIIDVDGKPQLILLSKASGITGHDPLTGTRLWHTDPLPQRSVASPSYAAGLVFATAGSGGQGRYMIGVEPTGRGDVSKTHVKFDRQRELPYVPTIIGRGENIYLWGDNGVLACLNPRSGEVHWTQRVGGTYSSSPICVDGKLYCLSEEGEAVVVDASPQFKLHGKSPLGEGSRSTPAVGHGGMYLRTFKHLACLPAAAPP